MKHRLFYTCIPCTSCSLISINVLLVVHLYLFCFWAFLVLFFSFKILKCLMASLFKPNISIIFFAPSPSSFNHCSQFSLSLSLSLSLWYHTIFFLQSKLIVVHVFSSCSVPYTHYKHHNVLYRLTWITRTVTSRL